MEYSLINLSTSCLCCCLFSNAKVLAYVDLNESNFGSSPFHLVYYCEYIEGGSFLRSNLERSGFH
jgi:hypothetical protein